MLRLLYLLHALFRSHLQLVIADCMQLLSGRNHRMSKINMPLSMQNNSSNAMKLLLWLLLLFLLLLLHFICNAVGESVKKR